MNKLAYIRGEEDKALWYYSQRIKQEIDPEARAQLQEIIDELKTALKKTTPKQQKEKEENTLTTISLSSHPL